MTEEESKKALFELHYEYMNHSPKERLELYNEYKKNRAKIRDELFNNKFESQGVKFKKKSI